jgi:hypothetical protein
MPKPEKENCQSYGCKILVEESYVLNGRTLCEDCCLEERYLFERATHGQLMWLKSLELQEVLKQKRA